MKPKHTAYSAILKANALANKELFGIYPSDLIGEARKYIDKYAAGNHEIWLVELLTDTVQMQTKQLENVAQILDEFGCVGPCDHGYCIEVGECEECSLIDIDYWCIICRIKRVLKESDI